jgi:lipopolysaccharide transport system ATP-binding protein
VTASAVPAVDVRHLSKTYPLAASQFARLRQVLGSARLKADTGVHALRDVSFTVERGEAFGIIGANGSGKSTLLQIIAGIVQPTAGSVEVRGRLSALLELGSGFSPEFSGRDNVYLNASILGFSRQETDARFATIHNFSGIGDFIAQPIRTYSTGMVLRLAFAVAAYLDPEILIVDEALSVGDIAFRQRCMRRIHELRANGATILFVSHEAAEVKALCQRCLWLQDGAMQQIGEADDVTALYLEATLRREIAHPASRAPAAPHRVAEVVTNFEGHHRFGGGEATVIGADLVDATGQPTRALNPLEPVSLRLSFRVNCAVEDLMAGFLIRNEKGESLFGTNTARENHPLPAMAPGDTNTVDFHWTNPELAPGVYSVSIAISKGNPEVFEVCDYVEDAVVARAPAGEHAPRGYFGLRCLGVDIVRHGHSGG